VASSPQARAEKTRRNRAQHRPTIACMCIALDSRSALRRSWPSASSVDFSRKSNCSNETPPSGELSSEKLAVTVLDLSVESLPLTGAGARDPSLLERARQGDVDALAAIYDGHHGPLCAFARRLLGNDAAAEDLVHDVFVALPKILRRADPGGALRPFLMAIAANRAKHHFRARTRYEKMTVRLAREHVAEV